MRDISLNNTKFKMQIDEKRLPDLSIMIHGFEFLARDRLGSKTVYRMIRLIVTRRFSDEYGINHPTGAERQNDENEK